MLVDKAFGYEDEHWTLDRIQRLIGKASATARDFWNQ
jgi:hypothetical protein